MSKNIYLNNIKNKNKNIPHNFNSNFLRHNLGIDKNGENISIIKLIDIYGLKLN